ncbi:hypothetical protein E1264_27365 [Actinomadura sp. KC216]|uniref:hypothetical protein n=1 Tax=Actinomadura sp. KC216 TaxID=2530370 RepID=UPI00104D6F18|nr:hypothetical protein [Actinomadura sp. KC216]TDB83714.1 hypothetical protein E1264_27365 [Actinomadura sp. KC216]
MDAPPDPENAAEPEEGAFLFGGEFFTDPEALAAALAERWSDAAALLDDPAGRPVESLRRFIERFGPGPGTGREDALVQLASAQPVNVRLLHVLRRLAPGAQPVYGGGRLDADTLWNLTRHALRRLDRDDELARDWAMEIIEYGVLTRFVAAPGGVALAEIERRRLRAERGWPSVRRVLIDEHPALAGELADDSSLRIELLNIAVDEARAVRRLSRALGAGLDGLPFRPPWLERQLASTGADPLLLLAAVRSLPQAWREVPPQEPREAQRPPQDEAPPQTRGRDAPPAPGMNWTPAPAPPFRERQDALLQASALAGAVFRAVAGMSLVTFAWWIFHGVLLISDSERGAVAVVIWATCLIQWAAECTLAALLGPDYRERALLPRIARFVMAPLDALRYRRFGRFVLAVVIVVVVISSAPGSLPSLVPLTVLALHLAWTYLRWADYARSRLPYV